MTRHIRLNSAQRESIAGHPKSQGGTMRTSCNKMMPQGKGTQMQVRISPTTGDIIHRKAKRTLKGQYITDLSKRGGLGCITLSKVSTETVRYIDHNNNKKLKQVTTGTFNNQLYTRVKSLKNMGFGLPALWELSSSLPKLKTIPLLTNRPYSTKSLQ